RIGHADANRAVTVGDEGGRLEPRVEAVPVDLGLDPREDLVPDVAGAHSVRFCVRFGDLSPLEAGGRPGTTDRPDCLPGSYKGLATFAPALFHNFFHSCGNLRGETLRSRSRNVAGRGLYHSNSTRDNHALT